jgi:hypothetical protein
MINTKSNFEIDKGTAERSLRANDSAVPNSAICDKNDNVMQLRLREKQALGCLRLTRDPNNAFSIDMGGDVRICDRRPVRIPEHQTNAYQISQRTGEWIDRNLTRLQTDRPADMTDYQYENEIKALMNFRKDMQEFRETASDRGLKPAYVEKTFEQIQRLMLDKAPGHLNADERRLLAEQIMSHAAHPTSIDQGAHSSCASAALESVMFTKHPGDAAKLITDIALTGSYTSTQKFRESDGKMSPVTIKMKPERDEEAMDYQQPGKRTFASGIFQVASVNLYYASQDKLLHNHLGYKQFPPHLKNGDTGERIVDTRTGRMMMPLIDQPNVPDNAIGVMARAITEGASGKETIIVNDNYRSGGVEHTTGFHNLQELQHTLSLLKAQNKLPVVIKVNSMCEPFFMDANLTKASGADGAHAVTIRDFNASTGAVIIDNQWGDSVDHGRDKPINILDLYVATQNNKDAAKTLHQMIDDDKRHGRFDPRKHMQQLRLANLAHEVSDGVYALKVHDEVHAAANRWDKLPPGEKTVEREELIAMTRELNNDARLGTLQEVFRAGIIPEREYDSEIALLTHCHRSVTYRT